MIQANIRPEATTFASGSRFYNGNAARRFLFIWRIQFFRLSVRLQAQDFLVHRQHHIDLCASGAVSAAVGSAAKLSSCQGTCNGAIVFLTSQARRERKRKVGISF